MKIHRFSKTQIRMHQEDCPKRYFFRYILKMKKPPAGAMTLGGSIHEAAAHNYTQKADSGTDLKLSEQEDFFSTTWEAKLQGKRSPGDRFQRLDDDPEEIPVFDPEEPAGKMKDQGVKMIGAHHSTIAPQVQPESKLAVEQEIRQLVVVERLPKYDANHQPVYDPHLYTLKSADYWDAGREAENIVTTLEAKGAELDVAIQLDSYIDVTDSQGVVRELKTKSGTFTQLDADKLVDLSQYDLARRMLTGKVPPGLALDYINRKPATPQAHTVRTPPRSKEQIMFHLNRIQMMARGIEAESFTPRTDWWGCSPKYCGYFGDCVGKGLVTSVDIGQNIQQQLEESLKIAQKGKGQGGPKGRKESPQKSGQKGQADSEPPGAA